MKEIAMFVLILLFAGTAMAADLGSVQVLEKDDSHVLQNPASDSREGGDNMASAFPFSSLPFEDTGATCDNNNDWDEECPYSGSTSPDVWYSFIPEFDMYISVDLEGSSYDTKTYILDGDFNMIACNDDFYLDYTSLIESAYLDGGVEYFIVIDGWGGDCGNYVLSIDEYINIPPPVLDCVGFNEGEPDNGPGYVDNFNGGCNSEGPFFHELQSDGYGNLTFCGVAGWDGSGTRDTDWFIAIIGFAGSVHWTVQAEVESHFFVLWPHDCETVEVAETILVSPFEPQTLVINGTPGDLLWLWAGASTYDPPAGFVGYNYNYKMDFSGLQEPIIATDEATFDRIKSMYR